MVVRSGEFTNMMIVGSIQNYDWGKMGNASLVARLCSSTDPIDENLPYAELWMGTHPSAPSKVANSNILLKEHLGYDLPFLFKVLSVGKALSIQAHPDLALAEMLHARDPKNYKDSNHKPEMAIALSPFEALCGFRRIEEIIQNIKSVPELASLVAARLTVNLEICPNLSEEAQKQALKEYFAEFITADPQNVARQLAALNRRLSTPGSSMTELEKLCLRLNGQFPGEVGCFCVFLLNYIKMSPGEAIFLAANEPHAYLSGDCIECMALSDNVVRAGLTPKFRDVDTLISMLTYKTFSQKDLLMKPESIEGGKHSLVYLPPAREFAVIEIEFDDVGQTENLKMGLSDGILICVEGEATLKETVTDAHEQKLRSGTICLLSKATSFSLYSVSKSAKMFITYSQY